VKSPDPLEPATPQNTTIRRQPPFVRSLGHASSGIAYTLRSQRNARIHSCLAVVVLGLAIGLRLSLPSLAVLVLVMGLVFVAELLNTAIEATVDLVSPEFHPQAKVAKDVAAGGVLVAAAIAVAVGVLILGPPLIGLIGIWRGV
jgi:undecaprenol kinase